MLKSSNFSSIIDEVGENRANAAAGYADNNKSDDNANIAAYQSDSLAVTDSSDLQALPELATPPTAATSSLTDSSTGTADKTSMTSAISSDPSNASLCLAMGFMQIFEPPLVRVRTQLKELISKQNKIYIDLSAEKYKLDSGEMARLNEMMCSVRIYREKLLKIRKRMQNNYQRMKILKKRTVHIETCKQKELQRKLQKQQQEEALIGKQ